MFNVDLPFFPPFIHLFPFVVPSIPPPPPPSEQSWAGIQEGPAQTETAGGGKWRAQIRGDRSGRGESRVWNRSTEPAALIESFLLLRERKKERSHSAPPSAWRTAGQRRRWRGGEGSAIVRGSSWLCRQTHSMKWRMCTESVSARPLVAVIYICRCTGPPYCQWKRLNVCRVSSEH